MTVNHTVLFGFNDDVDETRVQQAIAELNRLPELIPEVRTWEIAEDAGKRETSLRFALLATFDDMAAVERYLKHPEHVKVVARALPLLDQLAEHDYITVTPKISSMLLPS